MDPFETAGRRIDSYAAVLWDMDGTLVDTEPGLQGDRSTGGTKPATLETGATINVPLFLEQGTKVKVDTRDGSYLGRVS